MAKAKKLDEQFKIYLHEYYTSTINLESTKLLRNRCQRILNTLNKSNYPKGDFFFRVQRIFDTIDYKLKTIKEDSSMKKQPQALSDLLQDAMSTQDKIDRLFENFREFLKEKNRRYGDSAISPIQIFSKESAENQICNRLDDKLNRIKNGEELRKNDIVDITGYLCLYMISQNWLTFDEFLD